MFVQCINLKLNASFQRKGEVATSIPNTQTNSFKPVKKDNIINFTNRKIEMGILNLILSFISLVFLLVLIFKSETYKSDEKKGWQKSIGNTIIFLGFVISVINMILLSVSIDVTSKYESTILFLCVSGIITFGLMCQIIYQLSCLSKSPVSILDKFINLVCCFLAISVSSIILNTDLSINFNVSMYITISMFILMGLILHILKESRSSVSNPGAITLNESENN